MLNQALAAKNNARKPGATMLDQALASKSKSLQSGSERLDKPWLRKIARTSQG